jgi:hypothetical protein
MLIETPVQLLGAFKRREAVDDPALKRNTRGIRELPGYQKLGKV